MTTDGLDSTNLGVIRDSSEALQAVPFWTAIPARRSHGTKPAQQSRPSVVGHGGSQTARNRTSSRRARDACPPRERRHIAASEQERFSAGRNPAMVVSPVSFQRARSDRPVPGRSMPLIGFERLIADVGFSILDLDQLVGVAAGHITKTSFSHGPSNLKQIIHHNESYFTQIPARYGHGTCLDDALRCVVAKVRHVLQPKSDSRASYEVSLYSKALQSLQREISSNNWTNPDVLCATELISIYELLEGPSKLKAWQQHIMGSIRLIRMKGPRNFRTGFERSLLISMMGSLVRDAFDTNKPSFLTEPAWQALLREIILPSSGLSLRSRNYVWLGAMGSLSTRFVIDVQNAVCNRSAVSVKGLQELQRSCRDLKSECTRWRLEYDILSTVAPAVEPSLARDDGTREILIAGLSLQAVLCRLVGALSRADRVVQENEALSHSMAMIKLLGATSVSALVDGCHDHTAQFYAKQKAAVAISILATTDIWLTGCDADHVDALLPHDGLIDACTYLTWSKWKPKVDSWPSD